MGWRRSEHRSRPSSPIRTTWTRSLIGSTEPRRTCGGETWCDAIHFRRLVRRDRSVPAPDLVRSHPSSHHGSGPPGRRCDVRRDPVSLPRPLSGRRDRPSTGRDPGAAGAKCGSHARHFEVLRGDRDRHTRTGPRARQGHRRRGRRAVCAAHHATGVRSCRGCHRTRPAQEHRRSARRLGPRAGRPSRPPLAGHRVRRASGAARSVERSGHRVGLLRQLSSSPVPCPMRGWSSCCNRRCWWCSRRWTRVLGSRCSRLQRAGRRSSARTCQRSPRCSTSQRRRSTRSIPMTSPGPSSAR